MFTRYLALNKKKQPKHSFKNHRTKEEVADEPHVGGMIDPPFVVFDIDTKTEFEAIRNILQAVGIKTRTMFSDKGGHFWFKSEAPLKNSVKINTPLSILIDIRSWGKNSQVMIRKNGVDREWENVDEVAAIPFWLKPMVSSKKLFGFKDGDGRNTELFTWIIPLIKEGFTEDQILMIFYMINEYIFEEPLDDAEIEAMFNENNVFEEQQAKLAYLRPDAHHTFGSAMVKDYNIKAKHDKVYIYDGGNYVPDETFVERLMIQNCDYIKSHERTEIMKYLRLLNPSKNEEEKASQYINVKNGLINRETWALEPHNPEIFESNQINAYYDPEAKCKEVDEVLDAWSKNDQNVRYILEEWVGYCIIKDLSLHKSLLLLGGGGNGKSMYLDLIKNLIGSNNTTSVSLEKLSDNYAAAELSGKLVNIGGDISAGKLNESAEFKKLASGETFITRRIYGSPFELTSCASMCYAANSFPMITDRSDGFFRRWIVLLFDNKFKELEPMAQKKFEHSIKNKNATSYLLNLAIAGLKRIEESGGFTTSNKSLELIKKWRNDNNNVIGWLNSIDQEKNLLDCKLIDVYQQYVMYTTSINTKPFNINNFRDYILQFNKLNLELTHNLDGLYLTRKEV